MEKVDSYSDALIFGVNNLPAKVCEKRICRAETLIRVYVGKKKDKIIWIDETRHAFQQLKEEMKRDINCVSMLRRRFKSVEILHGCLHDRCWRMSTSEAGHRRVNHRVCFYDV